ncbi:TetR family transcriptional regulator [Gordonia sp. TBRC 11910]|uniref:TetR family transcriptional regulator n=1 Tax=Gordonia asplenii TaxID=2725283 RepID=A0A848KWV6_9ACTN|nr:TetR family transcriptional regulator [Gordonia asplenii]
MLSRAKIVAEAMELLAERGPKGLTIAALADSLGVAPSAIYNHVGSKRELLIYVQDHLIHGVDYAGFDGLSWEGGVRRWARSARDAFAGHPDLVPMYAVMPVTDSRAVLAMYDTVIAGFAAAGWPESTILSAVVAVESFVLGSALDANAPGDVFDAGELTAEYGALAGAVAADATRSTQSRADRAFDAGLDALILGLQSMLAATRNET